MYNFALAFIICAVAYIIGDLVSTWTKAWVPSVFVTAVVMLIGYWTIFPAEVVSDSKLIPFGSTIGMYLILIHMGSVISLKQLGEQWKVIVVCLAGLAGMCALSLLVLPGIIGRDFVIAGLPPLTGGIIAAVTMQEAAAAKGLEAAALFAIAMYCMQGFAGYPLTALCLQIHGKKMLKKYRSGEAVAKNVKKDVDAVNGKLVDAPAKKKKLIPPLPAKYNNAVMIFLKMGILVWIATQLGSIAFPGVGKISGGVWALLVGVAATTLGFLDENCLNKSNSYGIIMFALMMYIFDGLKTATPQMLGSIIGPMLLLIVVGVAGMAICIFIVSKLLKMDFTLALATGLTALYGFPPNAVITENTCAALAANDEEKQYLMDDMFPAMIVGGFVTVTITSVILAGFFANMF